MPSLIIEISDTQHGVKVDVQGDLHGFSDAAFVARGVVVFAGALFVGGRPVLLAGDADPVQLAQPTRSPYDIQPGQFAGGNFAGLEFGQFGGDK